MPISPVVRNVRFFLAHAPGLVRYGSKPSREVSRDPGLWETIRSSLRSYSDAVSYAPHQVLLGNLAPEDLTGLPAPWFENPLAGATTTGPHGDLVSEEEFYGLLKAVDDFDLILLEEDFAKDVRERLTNNPLVKEKDLKRVAGTPFHKIEDRLTSEAGTAIPLMLRSGQVIGLIQTDYNEDASLVPEVLLENLAVKASATMALRSVLAASSTDPSSLQYVIGSGEEAIGDRYQRGGGNLAKAVAEASDCLDATGADVKAFCCGPVHAMVIGGSLVSSTVFPNIAVVGGCSLAKLGMKFRGHLAKEIPIMEDVLVGFAILLGPDDGVSPVLRLDSVGRHPVSAGSVQQQIIEALVQKPLDKLGLRYTDIDKYATELHNPEITETAGSGDVPRTNYRLIAALAARRGDIATGTEARDAFAREHGMPGFSPTQGHVASAVPFMGHALQGLREGRYQRSMFLAKGSLFLGRMTHMADGESFVIESNPAAK